MQLKDGEKLNAELVVDASGRRSKLPAWLEAAGYEKPEETHVDSHIGYSMRLYEMPEKAHSLSLPIPCIFCCLAHQLTVKVITLTDSFRVLRCLHALLSCWATPTISGTSALDLQSPISDYVRRRSKIRTGVQYISGPARTTPAAV